MRKFLLFFLGLIIIFLFSAQKFQYKARAINIEVPVRVFIGDKFVDSLTIKDFEIYEDGVLQKIEAVYLIKKTRVKRAEEKKKFTPQTSRSFYLFFEIAEYVPRVDEAIRYFFQEVISPFDELTIITPIKTYRMKSETLRKLPKEEIVRQLRAILRKDAWIGNSEYRHVIDELKSLVRSITKAGIRDAYSPPEKLSSPLEKYEEVLSRLENLRKVDQKRLLDFATLLKEKRGQKYVFLFYQREFIPQLNPQDFSRYISSSSPYTQLKVLSLFGYFFRDIPFNVEKIKQAYSNASITINFLFFSKPAEYVPGLRMIEHSEDIFGAFNEIAQATGGITTSSANPEYLFRRAGEATENYYLLYYTPKNYRADGKFHRIEVKVKGKKYRVTHRVGYLAD